MPWKPCNPMDERLKFIARLLDGEEAQICSPPPASEASGGEGLGVGGAACSGQALWLPANSEQA
jgi:hypothetical protein